MDANKENKTYTYKDEYERRYGSGGEKGSGESSPRPKSDEKSASADERLLCLLCYLGPLFLVPYLTRRDSGFANFHSNQGLLLLILSALGNFLSYFVPPLGWLLRLATAFSVLIGMVIGIYNVILGEEKELPFIGWIRILPQKTF